MTATEIANQLEQKRAELKSKLDGWKNAEGQLDMKSADVTEFHNRHDEINTLAKDLEGARAVESAAKENAQALDAMGRVDRSVALPTPQRKSVGQLWTESAAFKVREGKVHFDLDTKVLMTTLAGFLPESLRTGDIVALPKRPTYVLDSVRKVETSQNSVQYMQQTVRTEAAVETAQGLGVLNEAALRWMPATAPIEEIPVWIPATNIMLEDAPYIQDLIDNELADQVLRRLDLQLLRGNGIAPNLLGIQNAVGIQQEPLGANDLFTGLGNAIARVEANEFAIANLAVMHPTDYWTLRLARAVPGGNFLFGDPTFAGPSQIFGCEIIRTSAGVVGNAVVGDFSQVSIAVRRGVTVEYGWVNDNFANGIRAIRASVRAGVVIRRPAAFCEMIP